MQISDEGLRLIKRCEGYGKRLPDGGCTAYQEEINGKLDIPTIGYGCTKGVKMGDVWSASKAEDELRKELAIHEARVVRLVTVDLNQNQFDALVSFDFNTGGLTLAKGEPSGVLKAVNGSKGDKDIADQLRLWNKFGGKVSKGLTARRAEEVALWLKPVGEVGTDYMPQRVEASRPPISAKVATVGSSIGTAGVATVAAGGIPAPPSVVDTSSAAVAAWKGVATKAIADPLLLAGLAVVAAVFIVPWILDKWRDA